MAIENNGLGVFLSIIAKIGFFQCNHDIFNLVYMAYKAYESFFLESQLFFCLVFILISKDFWIKTIGDDNGIFVKINIHGFEGF